MTNPKTDKRARVWKGPYIAVSLQNGDDGVTFEMDCCGEDVCKLAVFFTQPPEPDELCCFHVGLECRSGKGIVAGLERMETAIRAEYIQKIKDME